MKRAGWEDQCKPILCCFDDLLREVDRYQLFPVLLGLVTKEIYVRA